MLTVQTGFNQYQHTKYRQRNSYQLFTLQTFAKGECPQNDGEKRLSL